MTDRDQPEVPVEITSVSEQQFREWRQHPVSRALRRFLADRREALRRDHTDRWEQAAASDPDFEAEARGRALEAREIAELEWSAIDQFYDLSKQMESLTDETGPIQE